MPKGDAIIQLVMQSISAGTIRADGSEDLKFEPGQLREQLWNVESSNIVACVKAHKNILSWCAVVEQQMMPEMAGPITQIVRSIADDGLNSIGSKWSENGKMLKLLSSDKHEEKVIVTSENQNGVFQKLRGATGSQQPEEEYEERRD